MNTFMKTRQGGGGSDTTIGRLTREGADWIAHELDCFILLEPVSERAREHAENDLAEQEQDTGWTFADWSESPLEQAVAREIANGWNLETFRALEQEPFARMLAAILTGDTEVGPDDVPEGQWRAAYLLATRSTKDNRKEA